MEESEEIEKINTALQEDLEVYEELSDIANKSAFFSEHELLPTDITVAVNNIGNISLPVKEEDIRQLIGASEKAHYGLREETVLNEHVRDTHEIKSDQLSVTFHNNVQSTLLETVHHNLQLSDNDSLSMSLNNMLIYGPGQFFEKHRDSEKEDNMIGTVVMVLPSPHIGGDLVIEHVTGKHKFSTENFKAVNIKTIAFYADCVHSVKKVKEGYRVVLTYNLILTGGQLPKLTENKKLKNAICEYFNKRPLSKERKLVCLLNHQYTQHSLAWYRLKGEDRKMTSSLLSVAKRLRLTPYLVLLDMSETHPDHEDVSDELLDFSAKFTYWMNNVGELMPCPDLGISRNEICFCVENQEFDAFSKEVEETGNAGTQTEYWYHRAAVVLWPTSKQDFFDLRLDFPKSFSNLLKLTESPGNESYVIRMVSHLLSSHHVKFDHHRFFNDFFRLAVYVNNEECAHNLLSEFDWRKINVNFMNQIYTLKNFYSDKFCLELLASWNKGSNTTLIEDLSLCVQKAMELGISHQILSFILNTHLNVIINNVSHTCWPDSTRPPHFGTTTLLFKSYLDVLVISVKFGVAMSCSKLVDHFRVSHHYSEVDIGNLVISLHNVLGADAMCKLKELTDYTLCSIQAVIDQGEPAGLDWTVRKQIPCSCNICCEVNTFLLESESQVAAIKMPKQERKHLYRTVESLNLPATFRTERKGSPYTMIIEKTKYGKMNSKEKYTLLVPLLKTLIDLQPSWCSQTISSNISRVDSQNSTLAASTSA